jgi:hypothetical protein
MLRFQLRIVMMYILYNTRKRALCRPNIHQALMTAVTKAANVLFGDRCVQVYDEDAGGSDDFLGQVTIDSTALSQLLTLTQQQQQQQQHNSHYYTLPLQPRKAQQLAASSSLSRTASGFRSKLNSSISTGWNSTAPATTAAAAAAAATATAATATASASTAAAGSTVSSGKSLGTLRFICKVRHTAKLKLFACQMNMLSYDHRAYKCELCNHVVLLC